MGYSTPKRPFDLEAFLSQKASKEQIRMSHHYRFRDQALIRGQSTPKQDGLPPTKETNDKHKGAV